MIKTLFFDFGNVIAYFDHQRAIKQLARFTDMPPAELTLTLYGSPIEDMYERNAISTTEYVRLAKLNGQLKCTDEEFLTAFVDIFWKNSESCDLISRLVSRYRVILASNTNEAHFNKFTTQFSETLNQFQELCTSHRAHARKPEAAFFEYCQRFANAPPSECLFIDDLPANIEAAERHGWKGICYQKSGQLEQQMKDAGVHFD